MRQNMVNIPNSMIEAAKLDGANEIKIFWRVVMPMVKPAWLTLIIFSFQAMWNSMGGSFVYNESLKVLPAVMSQIVMGGIARAGVGAAAAIFLMTPPIIIFVLAQSNVIETMANSGIKE